MGGIAKAATGLLSGLVGGALGTQAPQQVAPPPPPPPPPAMPPGPSAPTTAVATGSAAGNQSAGARAAGAEGFGGTVITGPEGLKAGSVSTSQKKLLGE